MFVCVPWYSCGGQQTAQGSWFSSSTMWVFGIKLRSCPWAETRSQYVAQTGFELQSSCLCSPRTRITEIGYYTCQSKAFSEHCCTWALWEVLACAFLTHQSSVPWMRCSEKHTLLVHILSEPEKLKRRNCDQGRIEGHQGLRGRLAPSSMGEEGTTTNPKQPFLHCQGNQIELRVSCWV